MTSAMLVDTFWRGQGTGQLCSRSPFWEGKQATTSAHVFRVGTVGKICVEPTKPWC